MMKDGTLGIVIPAYKEEYLRDTLLSFSKQTNKNFTLYVGDDASPFDLRSIVDSFGSSLHIHYHRFANNLGSASLTSQWKRCIDLARSEEWIWLFSDDDLVAPNCVQAFYDVLEETKGIYDLYHFNSAIIDKEGKTLYPANQWPKLLSSSDFLTQKLSFKINSFACEYIFRKQTFDDHGFVEFPLAWCSDDATWASLGKEKGIFTIQEASVSWRYSGNNLSSDYSKNYEEKKEAILLFYAWINRNFPNLISDSFKKIQTRFFAENIHYYKEPRNLLSAHLLSNTLAKAVTTSYGDVMAAMLRSLFRLQLLKLKKVAKRILGRP